MSLCDLGGAVGVAIEAGMKGSQLTLHAEDQHITDDPLSSTQVTSALKVRYDSSLVKMQQLLTQGRNPLNRMILEREVAFVNDLCPKLNIDKFDLSSILESWK